MKCSFNCPGRSRRPRPRYRFSVSWGPTFLFKGNFSLCLYMIHFMSGQYSGDFCVRTKIPFMMDLTLWPIYLPNDIPPITVTLMIRFQHLTWKVKWEHKRSVLTHGMMIFRSVPALKSQSPNSSVAYSVSLVITWFTSSWMINNREILINVPTL